MDLISLLAQILGDYNKHANGEYYFACPFCHHRNKKLAINTIKNKWHCWHCDAKGGSIVTLFKRIDVSAKQLKELRELLNEKDVSKFKIEEKTVQAQLRLPPEFKPLWIPTKSLLYKHAMSYLVNRGITVYDIIRYKMGYAESGLYQNRIIVPSYDLDNNLNYFVGRSFFETNFKYKNPPVSKNVIVFENQVNWNYPLILCEGVFDAITVRRNCIPLLGKHIPPRLMKKMITNKVSEVYVMLDSDASKYAIDIEHNLKNAGINSKMVVLDKKDPSEMGFDKVWEKIETARETTFKDLVMSKMGA